MWYRMASVMAVGLVATCATAQPATRPTLQDLVLDAVKTVPVQAEGAGASAARAEALEVGKDAPLACVGRTSAVKVRITQLGVHDEFGGVKAGARRKLLVLKTNWENVIPVKLDEGKADSTAYMVPSLRDHLYVVMNGRELGRIHEQSAEIKDHLPGQLKIDKPGAAVSGAVVFDIPADEPATIDLRFYDSKQGDLAMPLLTRKDKALPKATPIGDLRKTGTLEGGVFAVEKRDAAAAGSSNVAIDVRMRSLVVLAGKVATVADWPEWRKYMSLIVDGEYACSPKEESDWPAEPRFLPDFLTGGAIGFTVPAKYRSLELRCDFPNTSAPGVKGPQVMVFPIEGTRPEIPQRPSIVQGVDEMFKLNVWGQTVADAFAGEKPGDGKRFLVLDATVANTSKGGEWFQVAQQLKYVTSKGAQVAMDSATAKSPMGAGELLWVPGGDNRTFQMAFQIDKNEAKPRLMFIGGKGAQTFFLKPIEQPKPVEVVKPPVEVIKPPVEVVTTKPAVPPATKPVETVKVDPIAPPATKPVETVKVDPVKPPTTKPIVIDPPVPATKPITTVAENPPATQPATPPKPAKKFCTSCGAPIKPNAKFCTGCGARLE